MSNFERAQSSIYLNATIKDCLFGDYSGGSCDDGILHWILEHDVKGCQVLVSGLYYPYGRMFDLDMTYAPTNQSFTLTVKRVFEAGETETIPGGPYPNKETLLENIISHLSTHLTGM